MRVISKNGDDIWIELPCGAKTVISKIDAWILKTFPVWAMTGSKSRYVFVERSFATEFSIIREKIYLHRVIVRPGEYDCIDHINRDRLDNRRSNLRLCTRAQNAANTAPKGNKRFKGVSLVTERKLKKPYRSYFNYVENGKRYQRLIGYFKTAEDAAKAFDKMSLQVHGEFAYLNFPIDNQPIINDIKSNPIDYQCLTREP